MRVIFFGTPEFAVPSLEALINFHTVAVVITQPDRPSGRGHKLIYPPVKENAIANGIQVLQPERVKSKSFAARLAEYKADLFVVAAYGQILPEYILNIPKYGCINVHASLLPKYRGAAPIQWTIMNGEKNTGVTIIQMEKGIDTGDMLHARSIPIENSDDFGSLHDKLSVLGAEALIEAITLIENNKVYPQKQNDALSTYAPMIDKETGRIDWNNSCRDIINLTRGFSPAPGAYTFINGDKIKILSLEIYDHMDSTDVIKSKSNFIACKSGILAKCSDGFVLIKELQPPSGKRMSSFDYIKGHKI